MACIAKLRQSCFELVLYVSWAIEDSRVAELTDDDSHFCETMAPEECPRTRSRSTRRQMKGLALMVIVDTYYQDVVCVLKSLNVL